MISYFLGLAYTPKISDFEYLIGHKLLEDVAVELLSDGGDKRGR